MSTPRPRAYFLAEAQQPLGTLRAKLDFAHDELRAALAGVTEAQAQFTPGTGEGADAWGIAEVLRHIATVEPTMARRISLLGNGESTEGLPRGQPGSMADVDTRQI